MAKTAKPRYIVEIGTARGGTLFLLSRIAADDCCLISVDMPGGAYGGGYPAWRGALYRRFAPPEAVQLIRADSHDEQTVERVKELLGGNQVELLFIDGDHSYEGVKTDFSLYSPLVKRDGIIAMHDIVPHKPRGGVDVDTFWQEIKLKFSCKGFVDDWDQGWAGIGALTK